MKKKIKQKPNILQEAYHSLLTSQEEEIQQISLEYFPIQTSKVKKVLKEDEEIIIDEDEVPDIELTTIDLEALKKENKADRIAEIAHLLILKKV